MMNEDAGEIWVDRKDESKRLLEAIRARESLLIWGPADVGKAALMRKVIGELPLDRRRACLFWSGPASVQDVLRHFVRQMFASGNPLVSAKVSADGYREIDFERWVRKQSSGRLRVIVRAALLQDNFWLFVDHMPPFSHPMARLVKELIWRCETPVYLLARGYTPIEVGAAWSLYWTGKYRLPLAPLSVAHASKLLWACIRRFGVNCCERADFHREVLHLSGRLPGAIVKMCSMAALPKYQYEGRIKTKLLRVDYLMSRQSDILHPARDESVVI
jgi:hypothetical protein